MHPITPHTVDPTSKVPDLRHDLKNQLTGMQALIELLKRNVSNEEQSKDYLARLESKVKGFEQTLNQVFVMLNARQLNEGVSTEPTLTL